MYILYEVADNIATITLNRPEAANAQNRALLDELDGSTSRSPRSRGRGSRSWWSSSSRPPCSTSPTTRPCWCAAGSKHQGHPDAGLRHRLAALYLGSSS